MKPIVATFIGLLVGSLIGWMAHNWLAGESSSEGGSGRFGKTSGPAAHGEEGKPTASADAPQAVADIVEKALVASGLANDKLDAATFGDKLADLLTGDNITLAERVEAEGMKPLLNPARFLAFYKAYAKRTRLSDGDNTLNPILVAMGQKFGKEIIDTMSAQYPDGFARMDSFVHGWAMTNPRPAVDWFNALPDNYGRYDNALSGLVWGLAAKDGAMAGKILASLSPADQAKSIYGFASSFVHAHGLQAFDAWAKEAPTELATPAIARAPQFAAYRPPSEYVPWFTAHSNTLGIRGELQSGFEQWLSAAPAEAMNWLAALPPENSPVQSRLLSRINPATAQEFLRDNPQHPGAALLKLAPGKNGPGQ